MKAFCVKQRLFETQLHTFNVVHFPTLSEIKSAFPKADLSDRKGKALRRFFYDQHQLLSLPDFYRSLEKGKFPLMRRHAKQMMSLFGSTYKLTHDLPAILQAKAQLHCSH
ncbi:hypothetical protein N1851_002291 [Merluccius polli]|uniref:Uncharacterized protein n=1 Tax=Merluccius polli TaxID=89951 RepID=A0AA47P8X5_MERPO|nr:hypothetical protein N1851_002291 [Merluccius polli]